MIATVRQLYESEISLRALSAHFLTVELSAENNFIGGNFVAFDDWLRYERLALSVLIRRSELIS
ncbi:MAG: hypothetical protein R3D03_01505 [Geminicoccaceae bacterium]